MARQPLFAGLVADEAGNAVETAYVGDEPCYVVNDGGFRRHIASEQVDRVVLGHLADAMKGNEGLISEQTARMLGQDDIFSRAVIEQQLKNMEKQFDTILETGIPEEGRAYLGMMGFKIIINVHGEVIRVEQPSAATDEE